MAKKKPRFSISRKKAILLFLLILAAVLFLSFGEKLTQSFNWDDLLQGGNHPTVQPIDGDLSVHFIDVGQGDSILILGPEKTVLIDAGERDSGQKVINYLRRQRIKKIDLLLVTHPHSDHIGGMTRVVQEFSVDQIVMPQVPDELVPTVSIYTDLLKAISKKGLKIKKAAPGQQFELGKGALLTVLGPTKDFEALNDYSVVTRLTYQSQSFLFTGDAETPAEAALLESGADLSANVLKIAHHGSSNASSRSFLNAVSPQYAVISVGNGNDYGHPHSKTLDRLIDCHTQIYRTDLNGTVIFSTDGERISVITEK